MAAKRHVKMITALFRQCSEAVEVYHWLRKHGYHDGQICVLLSDRTQRAFHDAARDDHVESKLVSADGAEWNGAVGVVLGAIFFAAVGAVLAVLGQATHGVLWATLAGGGVGAMLGGLVGGLVGYGFPDQCAKLYDQDVKNGGVAIGVTPRNDLEAEVVKEEFRQLHGENIVTL